MFFLSNVGGGGCGGGVGGLGGAPFEEEAASCFFIFFEGFDVSSSVTLV